MVNMGGVNIYQLKQERQMTPGMTQVLSEVIGRNTG